ncbi:MAG: hypothetical protein E7566_06545 [Ruminococcaceae bacterium]|nr:hypothetical protein [Oscillospiraceae bacterium]
MSYDPYEQLANAIVKQAVTYYKNAHKTLKIRPKDRDAMYTTKEVIAFFRSDYFKVLTSIDPELLISKLRKEFE